MYVRIYRYVCILCIYIYIDRYKFPSCYLIFFAYCSLPCHKNLTVQNGPVLWWTCDNKTLGLNNIPGVVRCMGHRITKQYSCRPSRGPFLRSLCGAHHNILAELRGLWHQWVWWYHSRAVVTPSTYQPPSTIGVSTWHSIFYMLCGGRGIRQED